MGLIYGGSLIINMVVLCTGNSYSLLYKWAKQKPSHFNFEKINVWPFAACESSDLFVGSFPKPTFTSADFSIQPTRGSVYEQNRKNMEQDPELYRRRQAIVEHPFGTIKRCRILGRALTISFPRKEGNEPLQM
jgi:hypothetical protein